jgi:GT2 family glycosyltransferase
MNLSIIIPNYNGELLLKKNLPRVADALRDYKDGKIEIIIPDDCSEDNSKAVIESFFEEIKKDGFGGKLIENKNSKEKGFSKNVNRGAHHAVGDVLILLNTDVAPHKDFLMPLLRHFKDPEVFAVACMDESVEKGDSVLRGRGIGTFKRGFLIHQKGNTEARDTLWVSGGSGAFRKTIWDKLSGLDELYNPFYWEDIDLSYRAQKSGYKIVFEPESKVTHAHDEGVIKTKFRQDFIRKIAYRNQFIFTWKNVTDSNLLLSHIFWLPYHFLKALLSGDLQLINGFLQALFLSGKIIKARRSAKKYFVKKDREVVNLYV